MEKTILHVDGMSCKHCEKSIVNTIGDLPGVSNVVVDLTEKTVTVEHDVTLIPAEKIEFEIEELAYDVIK